VRTIGYRFLSIAASLAGICFSAAAQDESSSILSVTVGKSVIVNSQTPIERVAVGFGDVAEATAVTPREVLVSGKAPGSTSLIVWQQGGGKLFFEVNVAPNRYVTDTAFDSVRREIAKELPGQNVTLTGDNGVVYLRGNVKDLTSAGRAMSIASALGRVVNLLYVDVPAAHAQILLKVRFASLDRNRSNQLGLNLFSTGAANTIGSTTTQQFPAPTLPQTPQPNNLTNPFVFSDLLNLFLFRKDINLGATIKALEIKGVLQTLAEPNVLAEDGKEASFLAGGEFPYPVFQGNTVGAGAITIQFREFGIRLDFIPKITPRGTIQLQVAPEVSSLDFVNGLTIEGFNVPGLSIRKMHTEVELQEGQTFAIGGLLDKRVTETFEKMPIMGDLPVLGKFFQSKSVNRQNTELIVIVTPELVQPIPAGGATPGLKYPLPFLDSQNTDAVGKSVTGAGGPAPTVPAQKSIPVEKLLESMQPEKPLDVTSSITDVRAQQPKGGILGEPESAATQH
jgi:pilus assembly protein CpaC